MGISGTPADPISRTDGHDAVCFTAGFAGALFGAGTIHAYLAVGRRPPAVVAGISMGALSAAAMQRCYRELQTLEGRSQAEQEALRWRWFRQYVTALFDGPLDVFWHAIPDQSDFFADFPPIRDPATPSCLHDKEREARKQRYLLVKLGEWVASLPIKIRTLASAVVTYVRAQEKYPSPKVVRWLQFFRWLVPLMVGVLSHICFSPRFFPANRYAAEGSFHHKYLRWLRRPLCGWPLYLLFWAIFLAPFLITTVTILAPLRRSGAVFVSVHHICVAILVIVLEVLTFVGIILLTPTRGGWFLGRLLNNLGIRKGMIHDFHLVLRLTKLFDPDGENDILRDSPFPVVLVAAPLNTLNQTQPDGNAGPALVPEHLWAKPGTPLIPALRVALTLPPIFEPVRLTRRDHILCWISKEKVCIPPMLELIDGATIRQNPISALFSLLRLQPELADRLADHNDRDQPAIHVVYSVPLPETSPSGIGAIADKETNVVNAAFASLKLARRRDTQLEVEQTNFMSRLEAEIQPRKKVEQAMAAGVADSGNFPTPQTRSTATAATTIGESRMYPIFADEIAPSVDLEFLNPISPQREEVLAAVAAGCRRTLETLYRIQLGAPNSAQKTISCPVFLRQIARDRHWNDVRDCLPGLPEVCRHCTRELKRSAARPGATTADGRAHEHFPQLTGTKPRIVFVASGGVFRGAFHIGMIAALVKAEIRPDLIVGASVGSLMGGALGALFCVRDVRDQWLLLGDLVDIFVHVDDRVALTRKLKAAARELGSRGRAIDLSPARIRRLVRRGSRSDAGYAAAGAPPAVIDAISDLFMIPHRKTARIAADLVSGHVTAATLAFLTQLKSESLRRLDIEYSVMGSSLLELEASKILGGGRNGIDLSDRQPFQSQRIAFFGTTTNIGTKTPTLLGLTSVHPDSPYSFLNAVLSSSAFPCVFSPRRESEVFPGSGLPEVRYSDGGMFDNLPFIPAIKVLGRVQRDYRRSQSHLSSAQFLWQRYQNPDLFLAGSLNVNAEQDPCGKGPFENLLSIAKRTGLLQNNQKIRSFEVYGEMVYGQLKRFSQELQNTASVLPEDQQDFLDGVVNAAVLPIFPASAEHLNGTFQFCASLGMKRERIRKSIADGCYQTLKSFGEAQVSNSRLASIAVKILSDAVCKDDRRIPAIRPREVGSCWQRGDCPFFTIDSQPFQCPFVSAAQAREKPGQSWLDRVNSADDAALVHAVCIADDAHSIAKVMPRPV